MKQPSVYLKMRVLGAVDTVAGRTRHERIHNVAAMTFSRRGRQPAAVHLANHSDLVLPLQEPRHHRHDAAARAATRARPARSRPRNCSKPSTPPSRTSTTKRTTSGASIASASRRACSSPTTSPRPRSTASFASTTCSPTPTTDDNKKRLAFSMKYANQLWQADTMFGPSLRHRHAGSPASRPS